MDSSRDSSVWRSLAVTFGGGLALGAVGMKLSQNLQRPAELPPQRHTDPLADRFDQLEQRIQRCELAPATAPQLDQKVLTAVVNAVDARLHEHTELVERRLAQLESKHAADLEALRQDDRAVS